MEKHNLADTGNGNGTKLIWWILGIAATGFFLITGVGLNRVGILADTVTALQLKIATIEAEQKQLLSLANTTRNEQVDRTLKFATMDNKLSIMEIQLKQLERRSDTISDRVLSINKRLDSKQGTQDREMQ